MTDSHFHPRGGGAPHLQKNMTKKEGPIMKSTYLRSLTLLLATLLLLSGCKTPATEPATEPSTEPVVTTQPVTEPTTEPMTEPVTQPPVTEPATGPQVLRVVEHNGEVVATQYDKMPDSRPIAGSYEFWPEEWFYSENLIFKGKCLGEPEFWKKSSGVRQLVWEFEILEMFSNNQVTAKGKGDTIRVGFTFMDEEEGFNIFPEAGKEYIVFGGWGGVPGGWCDASSHPYQTIIEADEEYAYLTSHFTELIKEADYEIHKRPYKQYAVDKEKFEENIREKVRANYGDEAVVLSEVIEISGSAMVPCVQYGKPLHRNPGEGTDWDENTMLLRSQAILRGVCVSDPKYWRIGAYSYFAYEFKIQEATEKEHVGKTYCVAFSTNGKSTLVQVEQGKEYVLLCDDSVSAERTLDYVGWEALRPSVFPIENGVVAVDGQFEELIKLSEVKEPNLEAYPVDVNMLFDYLKQLRNSQ